MIQEIYKVPQMDSHCYIIENDVVMKRQVIMLNIINFNNLGSSVNIEYQQWVLGCFQGKQRRHCLPAWTTVLQYYSASLTRGACLSPAWIRDFECRLRQYNRWTNVPLY